MSVILQFDAVRRLRWWICGVDFAILTDPNCPSSERDRYAALGSIVMIGSTIGFLTAYLAAGYIFFPKSVTEGSDLLIRSLAGLIFGLLWSVFIINFQRLTIGLAGRQTDRFSVTAPDLIRALGIFGVTAALAVATAAPLQVFITERDGNVQAIAADQYKRLHRARAADVAAVDALAAEITPLLPAASSNPLTPIRTDCHDLVDCQRIYAEVPGESGRIMSSRLTLLGTSSPTIGFFQRASLAYRTNAAFCWVLLVGVWLLFFLPPAVRLLTDRGAYDFLVQHRNRQWLAKSGIEPKAYTVFDGTGRGHFVDEFYSPHVEAQKRIREIVAEQRFDDEVRRQRAVKAWSDIENPLTSVAALDGKPVSDMRSNVVFAKKCVVFVEVNFIKEDCVIMTREGAVAARAGDAIVTASTGERWPVPRELFDRRYSVVAPTVQSQPGKYQTRPLRVRAFCLLIDAKIEATLSGGGLVGQSGDWLVDYGDGSLGMVAQDIFERTYELL